MDGILDASLLSRAVDAASDAVIVADDGNRIVYVNQGATRMFGWSVDEFVGLPLDILIPTHARATHFDRMKAFAANGRAARNMAERGEISARRRNGEEFPAEISIIAEPIGDTTVYTAIVRDRSRRHEREEALRRSESRLKSSQRIARMGSWDFQIATGELYWSEEVFRIFGLEPERFAPSYGAFLARVHPEDRDTVETAVETALAKHESYAVDHRIVLPDGEVRHVHEQAVTIYAEDGEAVVMEGVVQDITERKLVEQALVQARNDALAASEAKSRFLATMSHELRTPLNAIIGFSQILAEETLGPIGLPTYRSYAVDILTSGQHLLGVIDTVLDAAKIDAGRVEIEEKLFSLPSLVTETVRLLDPGRVKGKGRIVVDVCNDDLKLLGDRGLCRQIIFNLCSNALKFSPPTTTVTVAVRRDEGTGELILEVTDAGRGMASGELKRATDAFVQLGEPVVRQQHRGLGLGLYLVRTFAEAHGGRLELESAPGSGTRVRVRFPVYRVTS